MNETLIDFLKNHLRISINTLVFESQDDDTKVIPITVSLTIENLTDEPILISSDTTIIKTTKGSKA